MSGLAGAAVVITGANFTGATSVAFNGKAAASYTVNSDTQITATVANGSSSGPVTVVTPAGTATSSSAFTVFAPPTISGFSPASGPVGTLVTITGTNFTGATSVAFNGKAATSFVVGSATQIAATVASGTTSGTIAVTTPGGTAMSVGSFTVSTSSATLDLTIDGLYVTQATQDYPTPSIPLVQNRSAWVRVFAKANEANSVAPQVRVNFTTGSTTNTLMINASSGSVPTTIDTTNVAQSWNTAVPAAWIQPGTQVVATVDPTNAIPESNESNNDFSATLDVRGLQPWRVTLVPIHTGDGNQGVVVSGTRTLNNWVDFARRLHPVADAIDVALGSVMNSSVPTLQSNGTGWDTVLSELSAKRTADGATNRYYYGAVHTTYTSGVAGLGYVGYPAAIGWDAAGSFPAVLAHEEGHNFNRLHAPCGGASNPDPNYPYAGGVIGVPGWDSFQTSATLEPASDTDVMGYCSNQWISDYGYLLELNFRQTSAIGAPPPSAAGAVSSGDGLLIWGRIEDGQVILEPAFRVASQNQSGEAGPYSWEARDVIGRVVASGSFAAPEIEDLPDRHVQLFSFIAPVPAAALPLVQSVHVKSGNQELAQRAFSAQAVNLESSLRVNETPHRGLQVQWDSDQYPVLMLRDAKTGEVRGFVRGGNAQVEDAPQEIEVEVPDAVRAQPIRYRRVGE